MTNPQVVHNESTPEYYFEERCYITEWWNSADDAAASIARARVEPGVTTRLHRLRGVTERYVMLEGTGRVTVGHRAPETVGPGDVVMIPPLECVAGYSEHRPADPCYALRFNRVERGTESPDGGTKMTETDVTRQPGRLRYGVSLLRRRQTVFLMLLLFGIPLAAVVALVAIPVLHAEEPAAVPALLLEDLRAAVADDPSIVFMLWLLPPAAGAAVVALLVQRTAWLRAGPGGIEGYLPRYVGFGLTGQTVGTWQVSRDRIRAVRLVSPRAGTSRLERRLAKAQRIRACRIEIETDRETIRLSPFPWYRPDGPDHRLGLRELSALSSADTASYVERTPIVESLRAQGITIEPAREDTVDSAPSGFDLARDPGMVTQLVLLFGVGAYALVDTFFLLQYTPLAPMPRAPFAVMLMLAIPLAFWLGRRAPLAERMVVSALTVAALAVAVYPGLLRFNAVTAEPRVVDYVPTAPGRFRSVTGEHPPIDLSDQSLAEYWAQRGPDANHSFTLLRGEADFWQLDLAPLYERTRAFYGALDE